MAGRIGAQIALLAFAAAIVAGLYVGNAPTVVLQRALVAMIVGLFVGKLVGWAIKLSLRDYLQHKKRVIDDVHRASKEAEVPDDAGHEPGTVEAG